ncbi:disulfide bond formation regulator [Aequorivita soesokkakensis]|uniref:Disulfide bond formation regulator n=1 Tax=Aequorivita soesokkakensis TaxID=1385699 RepID=A0A1A9LEX6_9FLAO|nr:OsmC family protein [Aequorivita soesokkakensis]OAD90945.1 disulfide bond formation regulator [Aequorivita soesokkakensis]
MKVSLNRINDNYLFEAKSASGVPVLIDNKTDEPSKGASPMELLLMGVGGCSAIDVVMILKKQRQEITSYKMEVEGQRKEVRDAKPFESMHVTLYLGGKIDEAKAIRAAQLSFEKYCSVSITLEASVKITYSIVLNGKEIK